MFSMVAFCLVHAKENDQVDLVFSKEAVQVGSTNLVNRQTMSNPVIKNNDSHGTSLERRGSELSKEL